MTSDPTPEGTGWIDALVNAHAEQSGCWCIKYQPNYLCAYHDGLWDGIELAHQIIKALSDDR